MGMLDGKVVLVTGGSRGQGRAHAVTSAREGADVVIVDTLQQIGTVTYPMAKQADFDETVNAVHPGAILTPMTSWQGAWDMMSGKPEGEGTEEDMLEAGYAFHALKGAGFLSPQRIADAALWLNSDLASAVTGISVPVDAGHLLLPGYNPDPVK